MTIRVATIKDAESISALNADVQQLHAEALPHIFKPPSPDSFPPAKVVELLEDDNTRLFLAEAGEEAVGYLYAEVRLLPETAYRYALHQLHIHHISVQPRYHHQGYGEQLIEAAKQTAQREGIPMVVLEVWSFNQRARRFFAKQGFTTFNERMCLALSE
ncbi:MAG: GNAT family N-acetyltransferase [Chloroflexota bacterium]|nr:GNAT family N-acetyltransferase [Chloroflexota bacterium]